MIVLPAQIESIASRKDKTIRLTLGTQELSPNTSAQLFSMNQDFCYIAIKTESFLQNELNIIDDLKADMNAKTPSQRLRNILYRNFEQNNEGYKDFNTFYISMMEKICEHYKNKLD
jgi:isopentenyldiphosphate isomerase